MSLQLEQRFIDDMIAHALEDAPNECCGLLLGPRETQVAASRRCRNAVAADAPHQEVRGDPRFRYQIDPRDILAATRECDENGWDIVGIYHSHTGTEAYPSPTDVRLAASPMSDEPAPLFPGAVYILVSVKDRDKPVIRAFNIDVTVRSDDHHDKVAELDIEALNSLNAAPTKPS